MALISQATVIVEATERSGSLQQGWESLRLGRPLLILARLFDDPALKWPKEMAHHGAVALNPRRLEEIAEYLPEPGRVDISELAF